MKTATLLLLLAILAVAAEKAGLTVREVEMLTSGGGADMLTTDTHRIFTAKAGSFSLAVPRHDKVTGSLELLSVTQEGEEYVYAYRLKNRGSETINQVLFAPKGGWVDETGIEPGKEAVITITSKLAPKKTVAHLRNYNLEQERLRLEQQKIPRDLGREFHEEVGRATHYLKDAVQVEVIGPAEE